MLFWYACKCLLILQDIALSISIALVRDSLLSQFAPSMLNLFMACLTFPIHLNLTPWDGLHCETSTFWESTITHPRHMAQPPKPSKKIGYPPQTLQNQQADLFQLYLYALIAVDNYQK